MRKDTIILSFAILLVASVLSCQIFSAPPTSDPRPPLPDSTPPAQKHWVQDERLRSIMERISILNSSLPTGLPDDVESPVRRESRETVGSAATLADELAKASLEIPGVLKGKAMSEADQRAFVAEAQTLHDQAIRFRDAAQTFQVEQMRRTMDQIKLTCISCHSRFREFSGDLDLRKVEAPQGGTNSSVAGNTLTP